MIHKIYYMQKTVRFTDAVQFVCGTCPVANYVFQGPDKNLPMRLSSRSFHTRPRPNEDTLMEKVRRHYKYTTSTSVLC